jgi:predicted nucleic acid-binding protein
MLFDTDILIWCQRSNEKAAKLISNTELRYISIQTYMELFQCARSKKEHHIMRDFLVDFNFKILPLTENIGHRAAVYIEEYTLANGLRSGDAIIAATAMENNLTLATSNRKHYKEIKDLQLKVFTP